MRNPEAVGLADIKDTADIGMGNLAGDADFAVEACQGRAILGDGFRQEFQRHRLAELEVFGAIDFAHGAASGYGHDAVAVLKDGARSESRAIDGAGGRGNPAARRGVPLARRNAGRTGGTGIGFRRQRGRGAENHFSAAGRAKASRARDFTSAGRAGHGWRGSISLPAS